MTFCSRVWGGSYPSTHWLPLWHAQAVRLGWTRGESPEPDQQVCQSRTDNRRRLPPLSSTYIQLPLCVLSDTTRMYLPFLAAMIGSPASLIALYRPEQYRSPLVALGSRGAPLTLRFLDAAGCCDRSFKASPAGTSFSMDLTKIYDEPAAANEVLRLRLQLQLQTPTGYVRTPESQGAVRTSNAVIITTVGCGQHYPRASQLVEHTAGGYGTLHGILPEVLRMLSLLTTVRCFYTGFLSEPPHCPRGNTCAGLSELLNFEALLEYGQSGRGNYPGFGLLVMLVLACAGWALDPRWPVPSRLL